MDDRHATARTMKITGVKNQLSSLVNEVHGKETRVLVEKSGIPMDALILVDDLTRLIRLEREHEVRFAVIERARVAFEDVPPEEIEREMDRIIARNRAANRAAANDLAATG